MRHPRRSRLTLLWGSLLSVLVYLVAGGLLVVVVHAAFPDDIDAQGRAVGRHVLMFDLLAQGVAAFLAGAVASRFAHDRWWLATAVMGGSLMLVLIAATCAMWSAAPPWFNVLTLAITLPFVALGAAWRGAGATRKTT